MTDVSDDQLQQAVEGLHSCAASLDRIVGVHERFKGETVWEGEVHVFRLRDHPTASICYAWSSPVTGSDRRKFYAVLGGEEIKSPRDAVRASIVSDNRG